MNVNDLEKLPLIERLHAVNHQMVAPSVITYLPPGANWCLEEDGERHLYTFGKEVAELAESNLASMRREGHKPFVDLNHGGEIICGEPLQFFWKDSYGVRMVVRWTPEARNFVLSGDLQGFSANYHQARRKFLGIGRNVGALLTVNKKPAFDRLPKIKPVTLRRNLSVLADRFVEEIGILTRHLPTKEIAGETSKAAAQVRRDHPWLAEAYDALNQFESLARGCVQL